MKQSIFVKQVFAVVNRQIERCFEREQIYTLVLNMKIGP